jgi:hypothetical protein
VTDVIGVLLILIKNRLRIKNRYPNCNANNYELSSFPIMLIPRGDSETIQAQVGF